MSSLWRRRVTRRQMLRTAAALSAGAAAVACSPPGAAPSGGSSGPKTLRILQWSHFVPAYDKWFDTFVDEWGKKNKVQATVDHISTDDLPARMAAEVASRSGHDLIEMNGQVLCHLYEKQLEDVSDIVQYGEKKWGSIEPIGKRLAYVGGRWVGWPNYYIVIEPQIRKDLFAEVGYDYKQVKTWEQYLDVGAKLKAKAHAAGLAISHCNDANHNWRAIMWGFGASEVGSDGKTITVDTPQMREFLKFAQEFHARANNNDVFAWDNASDNRWLASGVGGYIHDAISSMRSIQDQGNIGLYNNVELSPPVAGPATPKGISMPDSNVYVMWKFAPDPNKEAAREFLRHYIDTYEQAFQESKLYNQPMHSGRYGKPLFTVEGGKYSILQDYRGDVIATFGHPGPPNYAANQSLANFTIPDMIQKAVTAPGEAGIKAAIDFGVAQLKRFYT